MSQTQNDQPTQTATERAEELFNRMGQRFGYLTSLATQRLQSVATSIREQADRMDEPPEGQSNESAADRTGEAYQEATTKAEQMVDQFGQRISQYSTMASLQFRRAVARAREEAEDIWAEAQNLRRENGRKAD